MPWPFAPSLLAACAAAVSFIGAMPAVASPLPAFERDGGHVSASLGAIPSISADARIAPGVMVGAVGMTVATRDAGSFDRFAAARITHRLWTGPGGSAVGYLLSAGWKDVHRGFSADDLDSQFEVMPALVASLVLLDEPGTTLRCRVSYGPVYTPYTSTWSRAYTGGWDDMYRLDGDLHRTEAWNFSPQGSWVLNPEVAVAFPNRLEVVYGILSGIGVRYMW